MKHLDYFRLQCWIEIDNYIAAKNKVEAVVKRQFVTDQVMPYILYFVEELRHYADSVFSLIASEVFPEIRCIIFTKYGLEIPVVINIVEAIPKNSFFGVLNSISADIRSIDICFIK
jgi:hypothetical protein